MAMDSMSVRRDARVSLLLAVLYGLLALMYLTMGVLAVLDLYPLGWLWIVTGGLWGVGAVFWGLTARAQFKRSR